MNENVTFLKIADGECVPQVESKGKKDGPGWMIRARSKISLAQKC
jgi:hypothetical protein